MRRYRTFIAGVCLVGGALAIALAAPPARAQAPGPESFAKPPETPLELWDAVDYLVRTGQPEQAVPYLNAFLRNPPSDDVLLQIRDRYGAGSILQLQDYPATRPQAEPLLNLLNAAAVRQSRRPDRLRRFVRALTATQDEQDYAVEQLRLAGPYAVPALVEGLTRPELAPEDRALIVSNIARLGSSVVPALVAVLDSPDTTLAGDAAEALGRIGDRRALPFLVYPAARPGETVVQEPARRAIARITGAPYAALNPAPVRLLAEEARKYLRHHVVFPPGRNVELWRWEGNNVRPQSVTPAEAEGYLGLKFAQQSLALDPADRRAQAAVVGLALQKDVERVGFGNFPAQDPTGAYPLALAAGPAVLSDVLREALDHDLHDLSGAAALALGRVVDRNSFTLADQGRALIEALGSPDRRTRFAAASALVNLEPREPFEGSSQVVPVLAQFLGSRDVPRAVVIDGNPTRANQIGESLRVLGYDVVTANDGPQGFREAAQSADVELIVIEPTVLQGPWDVRDLLRNLRADARTAGAPIMMLSFVDTSRHPGIVEPIPSHHETEPNDTIFAARDHRLAMSGGVPQVNVHGVLTGRDAGDHYRLGEWPRGTLFHAEALPSPTSGLRPGELTIAILDDRGAELASGAERVTFEAQAPAGTYYLQVRVPDPSRGARALYSVSVTVVDPRATELSLAQNALWVDAVRGSLARVEPLVATTDPEYLRAQLDRAFDRLRVRPLTHEEREAFAQQAATLLAGVSVRPGSPFAGGLKDIEPSLAEALSHEPTAPAAAVALADVPSADGQRRLADVVIDSATPVPLRLQAAVALTRSLQRFGPLLSDGQERAIVEVHDAATDPALKVALAEVLGALRPSGADVGRRLQTYAPDQVLAPTSAR